MRRRAADLAGVLAFAALVLASAPGLCDEPEPFRVRFGQWGPIQYPIDKADLRVATEHLVKEATADWDEPIEFSIRYFDTIEGIARAIRQGELDVVHLDVVTFFTRQDVLGPLDPALVSVNTGSGTLRRHGLIVPADSPFRTLADLAGRSRAETSIVGVHTVEEVWLDSELRKTGLGRIDTYFGDLHAKRTFPQAVLSVFFGQSDCALVPLRALSTMSELNPQIGTRLRLLATSPPLLPHLVAFTPTCAPKDRERILESAEQMHTYKEGRQILSVFDDNRLVPCGPEHLSTVARLLGVPLPRGLARLEGME